MFREIADLLLPEGLIYSTINKDGEKIEKRSSAEFWDIPLVVLINGNSASASEILAGAVQDYEGRGTLVGEKTFGKAAVQEIFPIYETGEGVKITTAVYFTPNGRMINKVGIEPDVPVNQTAEDDDHQLLEAIKILKERLGTRD